MTESGHKRSRFTVPRVAGVLSAALGLVVLAGWAAGIASVKSVIPGAVEMKANTAVGLLLAGLALERLDAQPSARQQRLAQALGLFVAVLGFVVAAEFAFGWRLGIGELLFRDQSHAFDGIPGRMSPYSAVAFASLGLGLVFLPQPAFRRFVRTAALLTLLIGAVSCLGYLWNASELVSDNFLPPVAINTAVAFVLLGTGLFLATLAGAPRQPRPAAISSVESRTLAGFLATLMLLLLAGGQTYRSSVAAAQSAQRVAHTQQVRGELAELYADVADTESSQRNYLFGGDPSDRADYRQHAIAARQRIGSLARLVDDNPAQLQRLRGLQTLVDQRFAAIDRTTQVFEQSGLAAARARIANGATRKPLREIRIAVRIMDSVEVGLLATREADSASSQSRVLVSLLLTLAAAAAGFALLFRGIRRELAARALAEEALRRSEEQLAVTLNSIGDAVLATDTAGRVTRLNPVAEQLTGWRQSAAHGRPVAEVFRIVNEETRQPAVIPVDRVLATGEIHGLANHTVLLAQDGTERAIADSAAPIRDREGRVLGVVLVFRDVTRERAAEAKLAAAIDELDRFFTISLDFLCIASADGFFKRVSPVVTDMLGWTVAEFLARPFIEFVHPDDRAVTLREVEKQVRAGERVLHFENRYQHKDGSWRVLSWRSTPQPGGLMYATARDVTELKRHEDQIKQLNADLQRHAAQLEAANKELEAFSYSVSHDLRAPLRHVQGYVEMLTREAQGQLSEKALRFLRTIAEAGRDMGRLIDDLLSFSKMGRAELREQTVPLDELVAETRRDLEFATNGRHIRWTVAHLPVVRGDPAMLKQVFVNLLDNAVKYTRRRDPAEIEVGCAVEADGHIGIFVRDNGAGFDMQYADRLFGVFQRLHRADEFEGTGIGLANVRRIVSRHHGRTWAEGRLNEGATFHFTLPSGATKPAAPTT